MANLLLVRCHLNTKFKLELMVDEELRDLNTQMEEANCAKWENRNMDSKSSNSFYEKHNKSCSIDYLDIIENLRLQDGLVLDFL